MPDTLIGPHNRLFSEMAPGADETSFAIDNTSIKYFASPYYLAHLKHVQPIPPPQFSPAQLRLARVIGDDMNAALEKRKRITFHAVGDTGAARKAGPGREAQVADMMVEDVHLGGDDAPAFFFHLGDVVYYFGEAKYYYDQFYEPFRAYDRPISAVPGNHDGIVHGLNPFRPQVPTLDAFLRNFCAKVPGPSPDAGGLVRSVMTEPGAYFTLDAPCVSIIGLYSNVLEGPGVISSQGGQYPIGDEQLDFLKSELARLKPLREAGERAVIIAVHHPPLSADKSHGGSVGLLSDLDAACAEAKSWPDAILSGHAHLYQRFTRRAAGLEIPYVIAGSGGFDVTGPMLGLGKAPVTIGDHTLEIDPIVDFGYLTVTIDMLQANKTLEIAFHSPNLKRNVDRVVVDLGTRKIV